MKPYKLLPATTAALITLGGAFVTLTSAANAAQPVMIQNSSMRLAEATEASDQAVDVEEHDTAIDHDTVQQGDQEHNDSGANNNGAGDDGGSDHGGGEGAGGGENGGGENG